MFLLLRHHPPCLFEPGACCLDWAVWPAHPGPTCLCLPNAGNTAHTTIPTPFYVGPQGQSQASMPTRVSVPQPSPLQARLLLWARPQPPHHQPPLGHLHLSAPLVTARHPRLRITGGCLKAFYTILSASLSEQSTCTVYYCTASYHQEGRCGVAPVKPIHWEVG